jgi:hypothetical protein
VGQSNGTVLVGEPEGKVDFRREGIHKTIDSGLRHGVAVVMVDAGLLVSTQLYIAKKTAKAR